MDNRLTIGLMIHHLVNDYSRPIVKGASEAAEDLDVNIIFFPGRSLGGGDYFDHKHTVYEYQNNVLYNYVSPGILDGVIISAATIGQFISNEEFKGFVDQFEGMPVLTLENEVRGYPCLRYGSDGIKLIVNHLVSEHNCKNIAFVSGPKNNKDAQSRLQAYREVMLENDLEYDESMIAYGNFSEYSEQTVLDLLDNCGRKLDAICFANDQMCIGGYKAVRSRGLEPGRDIIITGYDDSEVAMSLMPMLTTVRADASILGYAAVERLVKWIKSGNAPASEELPSGLVIRSSCGCGMISEDSSRLSTIVKNMSTEETARTIVNILAGTDVSTKGRLIRERLSSFFANVFTASAGGGDLPEQRLIGQFKEILDDNVNIISHDVILNMLDAAEKICMDLVGNIHSKQIKIIHMFEQFNRAVTDFMLSWFYVRQADDSLCTFLISNIAKDMIMYMEDEEQCFNSITNNLHRIHVRSSYIYVYEKPIINPPNSQWDQPEKLYLKSYHVGDMLYTPKGDDQIIPWKEYANNRYSPENTRRTMVLSPLYSNEEQYGLMLCDLDPEYFQFVYSTAPQVCTAIKLTGLVKRLEGSIQLIQNKNTMLNKISMSDELTGVFNRRGFYKYADDVIHNEVNKGKVGVLIFGDLDNLKKINDTFGHDDGDYAIRTAAGYLKKALRDSDIVARIGGDEFAAFAVVTPEMAGIIKDIPPRIKAIAAEHNKQSEKPYNVCMSVGIHTFECGADISIRDYMDKADSALYKDKKNKALDIMKKPENE